MKHTIGTSTQPQSSHYTPKPHTPHKPHTIGTSTLYTQAKPHTPHKPHTIHTYSAKSVAELKKKVKGQHLEFVLCLSEVIGLDACQSNEIYEVYLSGVYRGALGDLGQELGDDKKRGVLLNNVTCFYQRERIHLLRCVHHLLSYWQDSSHPYQV